MFGVCYTFELLVRHFEVATVAMRDSRKFGVMPIYTTALGQKHALLGSFGDRLFAFEHRNWEAIDLDEARLTQLGGGFLAQESRDGFSKGRAILGLDLGSNIETYLEVNGQTVNECYDVFPAAGRILLQTEGFEIFFRKFELHPLK